VATFAKLRKYIYFVPNSRAQTLSQLDVVAERAQRCAEQRRAAHPTAATAMMLSAAI
jgi:hypothetical protein